MIEKIMMHKWLKYILYYIQVESYRIDYEKNKTYILSKSTAFSRIYNKIYDHSNKFISRLCNMNMHKSTLLSKSKLTTKVDPTLSMQITTQTLQSFTSNLNTRWRYKIISIRLTLEDSKQIKSVKRVLQTEAIRGTSEACFCLHLAINSDHGQEYIKTSCMHITFRIDQWWSCVWFINYKI